MDELLKELSALAQKMEEYADKLMHKAGSDDMASLNKLIQDCRELDASPVQAAKDAAQAMFPKAAAAHQLKGHWAMEDSIKHTLELMKAQMEAACNAADAALTAE